MIKLLQVEQKSKRKAIMSYSAHPTPAGAIANGDIRDPKLLVAMLKDMKQKSAFRGKAAALAIDSRLCRIKAVTMPYLTRRELPRAMQYEVEKHFSLTSNKYVAGFTLVEKNTGSNPPVYKYLLAAVEKERSDMITDLALQAGLKPLSLEPDISADLRTVEHITSNRQQKIDSLTILLDLGFSRTRILILSGNRYRFHRSVNTGLNNFKQASGKTAFKVAAQNLLQGIIQSTDFYMAHEEILNVQNEDILAWGGSLYLPGLAEYLQKELGCKIKLLNILNLSNKKEGLLYPTAFGLAIRGWDS